MLKVLKHFQLGHWKLLIDLLVCSALTSLQDCTG